MLEIAQPLNENAVKDCRLRYQQRPLSTSKEGIEIKACVVITSSELDNEKR